MKHSLLALALALALTLSTLPAAALPAATGQQADEVLTNTDILTLTEAGLPTMLIVAKIEVAPTEFDTTVEALVTMFEAGVDPTVLLAMMRTPASLSRSIDFGDDTGAWAHDGECDDPRFRGDGMAASPLSDDDLRRDATDCRELFESGRITLRDVTDEPN